MSTYEELRDELRSLTKSTYIVNQKNPRTYDREWSIYCWYSDDSIETVLTRDDEESRNQAMRLLIHKAKRCNVGYPSVTDEP